jgi:hypothetical protein
MHHHKENFDWSMNTEWCERILRTGILLASISFCAWKFRVIATVLGKLSFTEKEGLQSTSSGAAFLSLRYSLVGYRLDIRDSIPTIGRDFFLSYSIQTRHGAHLASYPMDTERYLPGCMKQATHFHLEPMLMYGAPPYVLMAWCLIKNMAYLHGTVLNWTLGHYLYLKSVHSEVSWYLMLTTKYKATDIKRSFINYICSNCILG